MELTLLSIGVLLVAGLVFFAAVVAVLKLVLFLVFLPLRLAFRLVLVPVRVALALLFVPLFLILGAACSFGLLAGLFAITIPLLPFALVVFAVWVMVRRGRAPRAV